MSSDIWNPWHGCRKYSEGCDHCYMHYLDNERGKSGGEIYKVKTNSDLLNSYPHYSIKITTLYITFVTYNVVTFIFFDTPNKTYSCIR